MTLCNIEIALVPAEDDGGSVYVSCLPVTTIRNSLYINFARHLLTHPVKCVTRCEIAAVASAPIHEPVRRDQSIGSDCSKVAAPDRHSMLFYRCNSHLRCTWSSSLCVYLRYRSHRLMELDFCFYFNSLLLLSGICVCVCLCVCTRTCLSILQCMHPYPLTWPTRMIWSGTSLRCSCACC